MSLLVDPLEILLGFFLKFLWLIKIGQIGDESFCMNFSVYFISIRQMFSENPHERLLLNSRVYHATLAVYIQFAVQPGQRPI